MSNESKHFYEFGPYRVDPDQRVLLRDNQPVPLQPKAFETLLVLIQHSQKVVLKDDLMKSLWPDSFVEESNLSQNIFVLRKALGDTGTGERYIVTLPGRGYRFAADVKEVNTGDVDLAVESHTRSRLTIEQIESSRHGLAAGFRLSKVGRTPWKWAGLILVVVMIGAVLYLAHRWPSDNTSRARIIHKQFTFVGNAYFPAISPDGTLVAYVSTNPGEEQKLMVQAADGSKLELARGRTIMNPRWSPDGSELLFFRNQPAFNGAEPAPKDFGIFVVSRLGGVARQIDLAIYACWLAPDGSQVVVANQAVLSGFKGVRLVNKVTGEAKRVQLSEYTWLGDIDCSARAGLILAVTKTSEKFQIRTFRPDGSDERKLVEESDEIYSARWSAAGDSIYYLHGQGSTKELSRLFLARGHSEPAMLADGLQTGEFFTLSSDGSRLAYTREGHTSNLWRVALPAAGKKAKPEVSRLTSGTSYYGAPSFSPDGRWIAFALGPNPDETNIFKMQLAGGEPVQVTFFQHATTASPAWSPDGQHIAFISDQSGRPKVWTISANGGSSQLLENTNASDTNNKLAWWPSSDIVYQQPGNRNFLQINDKTHEEKPIIQRDQSTGWVPGKPVFSLDGRKMAVAWNRKDAGLWIISREPYSETLLRSGDEILPLGSSPDGKYVYAIRGLEPRREIIRLQVATPHDLTSVATLPGDVVEYDGASLSPDGQEIVVSVSEEKSDVWLMENFDPSAPRTKAQSN
jgi:Tol biopolymer transport system component/DNA-binding winged helix-turn-helix (wHTH) protein